MAVATDLFSVAPEDVHDLYTELRETDGGVHFIEPANFWVVLRYKDIAEIYRQRETYSSEVFSISPASLHDADDPVHQRFIAISRRLILFQDPPVHTRLRGLVRQAFTPKAVKLMEQAVQRVSTDLVAELRPGEEIDFMTTFAEVLPVWVIAEMLGVPIEDRAQFRAWSYSFASTLDPACQGEDRDRAIRSSVELIDYLDRLVEARRDDLSDDVLSLLITAEEEGDRLTGDELAAMIAMLLVAGNETTTNLIANGLSLLFGHRDQLDRLISKPELIESAIEEMLRYEPPLRWNTRTATTDVTLGEKTIEAGQLVWICIAAANRDPEQFADPDVFDIERAENRHLAFGSGIHYCLGAPLARLEARIALPRLLERFPQLEPGATEPTYKPDFIARGFADFPVRLE